MLFSCFKIHSSSVVRVLRSARLVVYYVYTGLLSFLVPKMVRKVWSKRSLNVTQGFDFVAPFWWSVRFQRLLPIGSPLRSNNAVWSELRCTLGDASVDDSIFPIDLLCFTVGFLQGLMLVWRSAPRTPVIKKTERMELSSLRIEFGMRLQRGSFFFFDGATAPLGAMCYVAEDGTESTRPRGKKGILRKI